MRRALVLASLALACRPPAAPAPTPVAAAPAEPAPAEPPADEPATEPPPPPLSEPELSARKDEVNRRYDQQDFEGAIAGAEVVLAQLPDDVRMLRVATSAHCVLGNAGEARAYWSRLPEPDRRQIAIRCARFGITLP